MHRANGADRHVKVAGGVVIERSRTVGRVGGAGRETKERSIALGCIVAGIASVRVGLPLARFAVVKGRQSAPR